MPKGGNPKPRPRNKRKLVSSSSVCLEAHAFLIVPLRGHGRRRDARRRLHIIHVADQGLRMKPEGFTLLSGNSVRMVSNKVQVQGSGLGARGFGRSGRESLCCSCFWDGSDLPPHNHLV